MTAPTPLRIYIGTEDNQFVAQQVLAYSIETQASVPVAVIPTYAQQLQFDMSKLGGTKFGLVRFNVPHLAGYRGRAIYLDADQLVFADIKDLFDSLDSTHAIACVQQPRGTYNDQPLEPGNYSSVMVLNCARLADWNPATLFNQILPNDAPPVPGKIHYKDFIQLQAVDQSRIQPLDAHWNQFNEVTPETKLVHFSHVSTQPWKNPKHPLAPLWTQWLRRAIKAGYLSRWQVFTEIRKKHLHKHYYRVVFGL